tara:strand:- start:834 stop:1274 length:441 start_codon:yes stop_codon:yes gene_type:complete
MAHFAELDNNNIVKRVVVVGNDVETAAGPLGTNDMHVDGETWCVNFFKGGNWKQTSYNHNFRKQYAGKGYTFDAAKNKFISPQPYTSWALDGNDDWQAPVTYPTDTEDEDKRISWDEAGQKWTATDDSDPVNNFNWDASGLTWVSA